MFIPAHEADDDAGVHPFPGRSARHRRLCLRAAGGQQWRWRGGTTFDPQLVAAVEAEAKKLMGNQKLSGSLSVMGDNSGSEAALLQAFYKPFTEATGVRVNYTGSGDNLNVVQSRVAAGNPPDLVTTAPGVMGQYAQTHKLLDLSSFMSGELTTNFTPSVNQTASIGTGAWPATTPR